VAELSRREIEDLDRSVNVSNIPPPETIERLCDTALAALDRADNLAFELRELEQMRMKDNAYLLERAEKAEHELAQASTVAAAWRARVRDEALEEAACAAENWWGRTPHPLSTMNIEGHIASTIRVLKGGKP